MPRAARSAEVHIELVFHTTPQAGSMAAPAMLQRPDPAAVRAVMAWLNQQGITSHDAGFSVSASMPLEVFERHFGRHNDPTVPKPLCAWIREVILPPAPTFF
ncbi:MAG: hypothetical protein KIT35_12970 [Piscinibacter sp.]|uniref:hypothetical protein n=1 Tax=Piscinibacter sp. TaxID=1903157 RepID=UPI00258D5880|nr:hypothetical protein [Piscinibacter sp.]MCW5664742.1 hypothetical protein [Piscinibacter sp.]